MAKDNREKFSLLAGDEDDALRARIEESGLVRIGQSAARQPHLVTAPPPTGPAPSQATPEAPRPSRSSDALVRVAFDVSPEFRDMIQDEARRRRVSVRCFLAMALQSFGLNVPSDELVEDGRRRATRRASV